MVWYSMPKYLKNFYILSDDVCGLLFIKYESTQLAMQRHNFLSSVSDISPIKISALIAVCIYLVSLLIVTNGSIPPAYAANDKFGIKMIYPTKSGGEEWFINMDNPTADTRFNPKTTLSKNDDGSFKVTSNKVRMNVYTTSLYDKSKITTVDQIELDQKGYMQSPNDWRNIEITGYVKVNTIPAGLDDDFTWYGRGGQHDGVNDCEGTAYKGDLFFSGKTRYSKQQWYPDGYSFTPKIDATTSIEDRWVGFKFVMYNTVENGKTFVKLESWLDDNNDNTWEKINEKTDNGGWGSDGAHCGGAPDQLITWGGPTATFRWDTATDVDFKNLSVREIQAGSSGSTTTPVQTVLTLNSIPSVAWGKDVTVTGKMVDASNNVGVADKTITFDGTGAANLPDVITNADGTFTAKGVVSSTVATGWKVQAHFAGDSSHGSSNSAVKSYNTLKHSVTLVVSAASNVPWSKPTTFTATLTDTSLGGVPIESKTIHFDGTGVKGVSDKTTDSAGKAIGTGTAPETVASGWTFQAHFAGDSLYANKDSTVKTYSTTKHGTTSSMAVSPATVASDKTYKVYGVLKDSTTGVVLSSKTITFTADSPITIADKTTDTAGKYNSGPLPAPDDAGTYDIQAHFGGDSLYNAKDYAVKTLTVTTTAAATSSVGATEESTTT
jgi:hypothetical protein